MGLSLLRKKGQLMGRRIRVQMSTRASPAHGGKRDCSRKLRGCGPLGRTCRLTWCLHLVPRNLSVTTVHVLIPASWLVSGSPIHGTEIARWGWRPSFPWWPKTVKGLTRILAAPNPPSGPLVAIRFCLGSHGKVEPGTKSQEWDTVALSPHRSGLARVPRCPERRRPLPFPQ